MSIVRAAMNHGCRGFAAFLLLACAACWQLDARDDASVPSEFPLIRLQGVDRADADSASFRGKVLVVNVWATWCPPCRKEMPSLGRLHAQLDPTRAALIGLSVENDDHQVREWLRQSGIAFPNYLDTATPSARDLLRVASYPQTFIVAADGKLIARYEGARDWGDPKWPGLIHDASAEKLKAQR